VTADQWGKPDRNATGEPICRWCRGPVTPPRRTFCGDPCVHEWKIRSSPWYVRREVKKRDKGICRLCETNVVKAHREWTRAKPPASDRAARRRWRADRPRWEADHIVPVADGGGECGLENYRLLCRPCHVRVTLEWRAQRQQVLHLTPESVGGIDPGGTSGGHVRREQRRESEPEGHRDVGDGIEGRYPVQQRGHDARRRAGRNQANQDAGGGQQQPLAQEQSGHVA
jgi:5-methylcytosine-specific restriction enzyme A